MNNIRTFILSSSAALSCWLIAAYTYEPSVSTIDNSVSKSDNQTKTLTSSKTLKAETKGQSKAADLASMTNVKGQ